jgi:hypothetical protein
MDLLQYQGTMKSVRFQKRLPELILASVDSSFAVMAKPTAGTRFIDDMEFVFWKRSDAEDALNVLESLLHKVELQLNYAKTEIIELPTPVESGFVANLRRFDLPKKNASRFQWIDFLTQLLSTRRLILGVTQLGMLSGVPNTAR